MEHVERVSTPEIGAGFCFVLLVFFLSDDNCSKRAQPGPCFESGTLWSLDNAVNRHRSFALYVIFVTWFLMSSGVIMGPSL